MPYRIYAFVNKIETDYSHLFEIYLKEPVELKFVSESHAIKLNILAEIACSQGKDEDYLMFIDGDAFPIVDLMPKVQEIVANHQLMAVRRDENNGDRQPHPSFAVTTVGFWKEIRGDWKPGYKWKNDSGQMVRDTGGNLLKIVENKKIDWHPILRTNKVNLHPVWFGVYGNMVYHHGAGFRTPLGRKDTQLLEKDFPLFGKFENLARNQRRIIRLLGRFLKIFYLNKNARKKNLDRVVKKNSRLSDEIFRKLETDENFWKQFV
ncbi:MAG: hypothetical protein GWM98_20690 [Nitrospinaceae bacterium]|nr:hypothetical protein [Nitrospinaceae bacterium]NIR56443.1 hypothetical protein [Nitrospinaceae bacterium]NIS86905.1 hypothetical protein [Nitrospinaceae bacterium]NIT83742.1 hypothetical protein [Nitrospinaceae bacterium]NIU45946.1 hypothetical protein [Nitrospinaceae bacterium]